MNINKIANDRYSVKKFDTNFELTDQQISDMESLLTLSPSSVNIQPWKFTIATTKEGKELIAKSTKNFGFNDEKIRDAQALIVFSKVDVNETWLTEITNQEDIDNRYPNEEMKTATDNGRKYFFNLNVENNKVDNWLTNQVYLNAGHFLLGVSAMGLDSVCMEGFDPVVLKETLNLKDQEPLLIIGVGKGHDEDYNKHLKTSRLDLKKTITRI